MSNSTKASQSFWLDERLNYWLGVAVAVSLPWTTSGTAILLVLWLSVLIVKLRWMDLRSAIFSPAGAMPIVLWTIAVIGTLWADVSWTQRLGGLGGYHKLLCIPLLLSRAKDKQQIERILVAFLLSCTALLILSWVIFIWPSIAWTHVRFPGVPVKDYVVQSGEFILCAFGLLHAAFDSLKARRWLLGVIYLLWSGFFVCNVFYVAVARTELVVIPVLVALFGMQRWGRKGALATTLVGTLIVASAWATSNYLRERIWQVPYEVELAQTRQSERFVFYEKSLRFIREAPLIGHGTGSLPMLFRNATSKQSNVDAIPTENPHNQMFAVAIQLGIIGALVLIAMWAAHALLFAKAGRCGWFGMALITQAVISNFFNTHLFDFTQGWTYVVGVGLIGAMLPNRTEPIPSIR